LPGTKKRSVGASGLFFKEQKMKLARTGIIAAAILSVATVAFAQKPDFSGTWTADATANPAPPAGGGGRGPGMAGPMSVTQTATTLTVERTMGENKVSQVYKLDGTESENKMTGRGGEVVTKSVAKWDGNKLTITTKQTGQDGTERVSTQTWSLDAGVLTIESTRPGRDGSPMTAKTVYKKTT
jgi:hypothetical protein